jgi:hypothetical protein
MRKYKILLPLIAAIAFVLPAPALAHQTSLKAVFIAVPASTSPVKFGPKTAVSVNLSSGNGGTIKLKLKKAVDAGGGKITATGNNLRMNVVMNGAAQTWQIPFDISNGNGKINNHLLGLVKPDIIQIVDMALEDSGGVAFGHFGFTNGAGPNKALASAIVQTEDGSFIRLAATRDADVSIKAKHGAELKVRFDKLHDTLGNDINAAGNRLEVKTIVNGTPKTDNFSFDIVNDSGEVDVSIPGLSTGDKVRIVSIEGFDPDNKRFAALGVRIQNPPAP